MDMQSKGEIIIHIGPPKTATTSFQKFFLYNSFNEISYEGIIQPRIKNDGTICKLISDSTVEYAKGDGINKNEIRNIELTKSSHCLLSEESFLVNGQAIRWQDKMEGLYKITHHLNPILLIVVRNPIDAIRSYYQEMYYKLDKNKIKSIDDFAESNYCTIYKYDELLSFIHNIGFSSIRLLGFDKLINKQYKISDIFDASIDSKIELKKDNPSNVTRGKYYSKSDKLSKVLARSLPDFIKKMANDKVKKGITSVLPNIEIGSHKELDVTIDKEIQKRYMCSYRSIVKDTV